MGFVVDFYSANTRLGGTVMCGTPESAVQFALDSLERHDAFWARVYDDAQHVEKRLCARAVREGHPVEDARICSADPLCAACPLIVAAPKEKEALAWPASP